MRGADDEDSTTLELDAATFDVSIDSTTVADGTLEVTYTVENGGDVADEQPVTVVVNGTETDSTHVLLDRGETETGTFGYELEADDLDGTEVEIRTETDTVTETVAFDDVPFAVTIVSTSVDDGTVAVDYRVENAGDAPDEQPITLVADDQEVDTTAVTLVWNRENDTPATATTTRRRWCG